MINKETSFGYRYNGSNVTIKLRMLSSKFFSLGINQHGSYRSARQGYVIFEGTFDTRTKEYIILSRKLDQLKHVKVPDKINPELPF